MSDKNPEKPQTLTQVADHVPANLRHEVYEALKSAPSATKDAATKHANLEDGVIDTGIGLAELYNDKAGPAATTFHKAEAEEHAVSRAVSEANRGELNAQTILKDAEKSGKTLTRKQEQQIADDMHAAKVMLSKTKYTGAELKQLDTTQKELKGLMKGTPEAAAEKKLEQSLTKDREGLHHTGLDLAMSRKHLVEAADLAVDAGKKGVTPTEKSADLKKAESLGETSLSALFTGDNSPMKAASLKELQNAFLNAIKPTQAPFTAAEIAKAGAYDAEFLEGKLPPNSSMSKIISKAYSILYPEDDETPAQMKKTEAAMIRMGAASGVGETTVGDCFFESALASLAHEKDGPQKIANMIRQTPEQATKGEYTVTFPGDEHHPITISEHEINKYGLANSAQWANVIEAAAVKRAGGPKNFDGGYLATAELLLTGKHSVDDIASGDDFTAAGDSAKTVANELDHGLSDGGPITAASKGDVKTGVVSGHAYTILGYDAKTGMVTLRNPTGTDDGAKNLPQVGGGKVGGVENLGEGEVQMSLSTFMNDFQEITYSP